MIAARPVHARRAFVFPCHQYGPPAAALSPPGTLYRKKTKRARYPACGAAEAGCCPMGSLFRRRGDIVTFGSIFRVIILKKRSWFAGPCPARERSVTPL